MNLELNQHISPTNLKQYIAFQKWAEIPRNPKSNTENPRVGGSIPSPGTISYSNGMCRPLPLGITV